MALAIKISTSGDTRHENARWDLHWLQRAIGGGYVEAVPLRDGGVLWCDEDGGAKRLPVNRVATMLALHECAIFADQTIKGDVLVTGLEGDDGVFADLPDKVIAHIVRAVEQARRP